MLSQVRVGHRRLLVIALAALLAPAALSRTGFAESSTEDAIKQRLSEARKATLALEKERMRLDLKHASRTDPSGARARGSSEVEPNDSPEHATPALLAGPASGAGPSKVTICHYPPGNPQNPVTVEVAPPSVPAHIALHGDTLGPCTSPGSGSGGAGSGNFVIGCIDRPGDIDYWSLSLQAGDLVRVGLQSERLGVNQDLLLRIFASNAPGVGCRPDPLALRDDGHGDHGSSLDPCSFFQAPTAGNYFLEVSELVGVPGGPDYCYELSVEVLGQEIEPNDVTPQPLTCEIQPEERSLQAPDSDASPGKVTICHTPPGNPDNAHSITIGVSALQAHLAHGDSLGPCSDGAVDLCRGCVATVAGVLDRAGDVDCFSLDVAAQTLLEVSIDGAKCANLIDGLLIDPEATLYDPAGALVAEDDDTEDLDSALLYHTRAAGPHKICVRDHFGDYRSTYFYKLTIRSRNCPKEIEPNNACATATPIAF